MNKNLKETYRAFNGKLVDTKLMKIYVCQVLSKMPKSIITRVTRTCWFLLSKEDAWAFTFTGNDLKNQHLIFLSDDLLNEERE